MPKIHKRSNIVIWFELKKIRELTFIVLSGGDRTLVPTSVKERGRPCFWERRALPGWAVAEGAALQQPPLWKTPPPPKNSSSGWQESLELLSTGIALGGNTRPAHLQETTHLEHASQPCTQQTRVKQREHKSYPFTPDFRTHTHLHPKRPAPWEGLHYLCSRGACVPPPRPASGISQLRSLKENPSRQ